MSDKNRKFPEPPEKPGLMVRDMILDERRKKNGEKNAGEIYMEQVMRRKKKCKQ